MENMYQKINHFFFYIKDTYKIADNVISMIKNNLSDYKFKYFNITKKSLFGEKTIHEYSFIKDGHRVNVYFDGNKFLVQSIMFHQHEYSKIFGKHYRCDFKGLLYLTQYIELELNVLK